MIYIKIYELITNLRLFPVCEVGLTTEEINDDHYFWMNARLGKLPDEYISHWGNYNENFDENGMHLYFTAANCQSNSFLSTYILSILFLL